MATSHIPATPGAGVNAATHSFSEDAVTKHAQRVAISTPAGVDQAFGAGSTNTGTQRVVSAVDDLVVTQLGGVTETPPATDTASSALNGRMQRLAQHLTSMLARMPLTLGAKAAASSLAVTASTEDVTRIGAVTETAPSTDTASSGLNGRLQRVAQRVGTVESHLATIVADTSVGTVSEPAPASDTSPSGLNGRLQRVAQRLTTVSGQLGTIIADTSVGTISETPPATDTAAAGLNGRLQRVAQNISSSNVILTAISDIDTDVYDETAAAKKSLLVDDAGVPLAMDGDVPVRGDIADGDPSVSPFPVLIGADVVPYGVNPTAKALGDRAKAIASVHGVPFVIGGHPNVVIRSTVVAAADGAQTNFALGAIAPGGKIVLTRLSVMASGANTVPVDVRIGFGASVVPAPTLAPVTGILIDARAMLAGSSRDIGDGSGILGVGQDAEDLRMTCSSPTGGHLTISFSFYTIEI